MPSAPEGTQIRLFPAQDVSLSCVPPQVLHAGGGPAGTRPEPELHAGSPHLRADHCPGKSLSSPSVPTLLCCTILGCFLHSTSTKGVHEALGSWFSGERGDGAGLALMFLEVFSKLDFPPPPHSPCLACSFPCPHFWLQTFHTWFKNLLQDKEGIPFSKWDQCPVDLLGIREECCWNRNKKMQENWTLSQNITFSCPKAEEWEKKGTIPRVLLEHSAPKHKSE